MIRACGGSTQGGIKETCGGAQKAYRESEVNSDGIFAKLQENNATIN